MALIKCHECGHETSDTANACPRCGAKPKKKIGVFGWIVAALFTVIVVRCTAEQVSAPPKAEKTAEQIAAEVLAEKRHIAAVLSMRAIKKALRDPSSVEWDDVLVNEDATVICIIYRAKNGFGGYTRDQVSIINGEPSKAANIWNKQCAGKTLIDQKFSARAL